MHMNATAESITIAAASLSVIIPTVVSMTWWLAQQFKKAHEATLSKLDEHDDKDQMRYESTLNEISNLKVRLARAGIA